MKYISLEHHPNDSRIKIITDDKCQTLTSRMGTGGNNVPLILDADASLIRKLTEIEVERLQGFPDNWTDIGEWTDSKGKVHSKCSSSARYKALGNSICTSFWKFLARRICAQYERDVTIGSLFDGISGFPYVFEQCGAIPVWASEIEEFPIAVSKTHFPEE